MKRPGRYRSRGVQVLTREQLPPWCVFTSLALVAGATPSFAADARAMLMVSANVQPVAHIRMASDLPPLQVSAADIALGYTEAPRPLVLEVDSNSRAGFALDVSTLSPWFTAVTLAGLDSDVSLGAAGGTVVQRWQGTRLRSLALRVRFTLAADLQPGLYAWPLQFTARPL